MTIAGGPYDPVNDLGWRLRESGGELYFETSSDGVTWKLRGHQPDPIPLDDVALALGAGRYGQPPPDTGRARFDCYDVAALPLTSPLQQRERAERLPLEAGAWVARERLDSLGVGA